MQWEEKDQEDGESLFDVFPSKSIVADDPLAVVEGQSVSASFKKKTYLLEEVCHNFLVKLC